jgi:hypothetical protein
MFLQKALGSVLFSCALLFQTFECNAQFTMEPIPAQVLSCMIGKSLPVGVEWPVQPTDLSYLTMTYWGYDDQAHIGHMVVHVNVAQEVLDIFKELFEEKFPIERMELIDLYDASDDRSMDANNTSAFCCRAITDKPGTFSKHSYGIAVDINPLINPYVKWSAIKNKWLVYPEGGKQFVNLFEDESGFPVRTESYRGIITQDNPCCKAFEKRGWEWGGDWSSLKDYQHFEKRI